jgi:hypothetical protein
MSVVAGSDHESVDKVARERANQISTALHNVDMANINQTLQRIKQNTLTETAISRSRRIFRWATLFISITSSIAGVARLYWSFSHPASDFALLLLFATDIVSSGSFAVVYAIDHHRRKGGPSSPDFPLLGTAEAPSSLLDEHL